MSALPPFRQSGKAAVMLEKKGTSVLAGREGALLSVIIPVYNVAPYLDDCLASVCAQTYRNIEIIVVDDGSTDGGGAICDAWREKDSRIRVIHQPNAGVSAARNAGLDVCTGQLISFVDSDDWLDGQLYEKLVACLEENDADAAMCGFVDYPRGVPVTRGVFAASPCDFTGTVYQMMRRNGYHSVPWGKVFRRERVFTAEGPVRFDTSLSFGEDEVWLLEVLRACRRTAFLPEALYHWRAREESISRACTVTEKQLSIFAAKEKTLPLLPDDPAVRCLARGRVYNDFYLLKVRSYCLRDAAAFRFVKSCLRPYFRDWLRSRDVPLLRKCKVLALGAEMTLRLPRGLVWWTNERYRRLRHTAVQGKAVDKEGVVL